MSSMKYALKIVPGLADFGVPHGDEDDPMELHPEGRDQKSEHTMLISMKNWRGWMCDTWPKGQNGREVLGTDVLFY